MRDAVFSGTDLSAALLQAEENLGLPATGLRYVVIDAGAPATATRDAVPVKIAVLLDAVLGPSKGAPAERGRAAPDPITREPRSRGEKSATAGEFDASVHNVEAAFSTSLEAPVALAVDRQERKISIAVSGAGAAALEDQDGEALLALETVLQRIAGRCGERARVVVSNPARKSRREASLRAEALRLAQDVKERGLPRMMPPLNSYERRVVHMVLSEVHGIKTYSVGDGLDRRLTIALSSEPSA